MKNFNQNIIKHKLGLLTLATKLVNISRKCKSMSFFRDTFYRYQAASDAGGVEALFEVCRRKPNLKNRGNEITEQACYEFALAFPAYSQLRASNELRKKESSFLHRGPLHLASERTSIRETVAADSRTEVCYERLILTETAVQSLERKKREDEA